jgi:hypothetical protein
MSKRTVRVQRLSSASATTHATNNSYGGRANLPGRGFATLETARSDQHCEAVSGCKYSCVGKEVYGPPENRALLATGTGHHGQKIGGKRRDGEQSSDDVKANPSRSDLGPFTGRVLNGPGRDLMVDADICGYGND